MCVINTFVIKLFQFFRQILASIQLFLWEMWSLSIYNLFWSLCMLAKSTSRKPNYQRFYVQQSLSKFVASPTLRAISTTKRYIIIKFNFYDNYENIKIFFFSFLNSKFQRQTTLIPWTDVVLYHQHLTMNTVKPRRWVHHRWKGCAIEVLHLKILVQHLL